MFDRLRRTLSKRNPFKQPARVGLCVTLKNRNGSVQHYYHFMLGFVVPLVHAWPELKARAGGQPIYVRSCAVMDPVLAALRLEGLQVLPKEDFVAKRSEAINPTQDGPRLDHHEVLGYDRPANYDAKVFTEVRTKLFDRLGAEIAAERAALAPLFKGTGPKVLMIDRLPADPFYRSAQSEVKTAGSQRRSVANMAELADLARARFPSVAVVTLEGRSLASQMALFSMADIIVAQHGASLANLLWARPGAQVVEFLTDEYIKSDVFPLFFANLATAMGLSHDVVAQATDHSPVRAKDFEATLDRLALQYLAAG